MEPALTSAENPMFSIKLWSRMAVSKAPLWLRRATLPGRAIAPAKVALRPVGGFMTPRQLGPTILILPRLASSRTWCSSSAPSDPVSLKPDRKSTRLNSSHTVISYAVFCLKKKKKERKDGREGIKRKEERKK